jgi:NAD+ synthase (glutamine-hydrolysing)
MLSFYLVQQNYHIGNIASNTQKIITGIANAKLAGAQVAVFSELCICGYPPRDFLEFEDFLNLCNDGINSILPHTMGITVIIGAPEKNKAALGKDLHNSAYVLQNGKIIATAQKTLLPTYDIFDEYRYFEPAFEWNVVEIEGKKVALIICEDIWNLGDNPLYRVSPMDKLIDQKPDLIINLSASPYNYAQDTVRHSVVRANVLKYNLPMLYVNNVGSQTEVVFDGGSIAYNQYGQCIHEMAYFKEDEALITWEKLTKKTATPQREETQLFYAATEVGKGKPTIPFLTEAKNIEEIYQALIMGIKDYFEKMGFKKAILGSSGGIDSAVTLALACEALGAENVSCLMMPSPYSTSHSVDDAVALSENLKNPYHIVKINDVYEALLTTLKPIYGDLPFNVAEENLQSRSRGNLLMGVANKYNLILLNTSNKSELATGYGTLYGDMAGGLGVLGDLYKMQVYALAKYINRNSEIIPLNILDKAPSAELRPDQKDSDSLPEYPILDTILYQYIEQRQGPKEIIAQGYDAALVNRILRMVNLNEYKRNQFCPIIRVSCKAFGMGRRMPIVAKYLG